MPFATINPATGKTEKVFPSHTPEEVDKLLDRALAAFADYRSTSARCPALGSASRSVDVRRFCHDRRLTSGSRT